MGTPLTAQRPEVAEESVVCPFKGRPVRRGGLQLEPAPPDARAVPLLRNLQRAIANSTRADPPSCEFGLVTASKGVIGGSQQFGQRPSAHNDAGAGELVEQRVDGVAGGLGTLTSACHA